MKTRKNYWIAKCCLVLLFLSSLAFFSGCSTSERELQDKFALRKVDFQHQLNRAAAWGQREQSLIEGIPPWGVPESDRSRVAAISDSYDQERAQCRKEARQIFLALCRVATQPDDFVWIYESKSVALVKHDVEINKEFLRDVVDTIFLNEHFIPTPEWIEFRKNILGREFYTK